MDVIRPGIILKEIRFCLVFFCFIWSLVSCEQREPIGPPQVFYEEGKAVSVQFNAPSKLEDLSLYLRDEEKTPLLGEWTSQGSQHKFTPVIAFTAGQTYEIRAGKNTVSSFEIATSNEHSVPEIITLHPTQDTLPENLLKMYIKFSEPMEASANALDFITMYDETVGKEISVFLELEAELWNAAHDRLTLWLDPGRIKTDLIPNRELGMPLRSGHIYELRIAKNWRSAKGVSLLSDYEKRFYTGPGDREKPSPDQWEIILPSQGSREALELKFNEPLDAVLLEEAFFLNHKDQGAISGTTVLSQGEKGIKYIPSNNWYKGDYILKIESKLEDLAGNNLNRLFDTDAKSDAGHTTQKSNYYIAFRIE